MCAEVHRGKLMEEVDSVRVWSGGLICGVGVQG